MRVPKVRAAVSRIPSMLKSHWLITALLAGGLALRVLAAIAYRPILFYSDSARYLLHADGNDPAGYRLRRRKRLKRGRVHLGHVGAAPNCEMEMRNLSLMQRLGQAEQILPAVQIATRRKNPAGIATCQAIEICNVVGSLPR